MCGIVGIFNLVNDKNRTISDEHQASLISLILTEGLYNTEKRGEDATGYFCVFRDGQSLGLKNGEKASKFIFDTDDEDEKLAFRNHLRVLEQYHLNTPISAIIGHCRKGTVGTPYNNDNNHPLVVDTFVGVHNGTLSNHNTIEEKLNIKRTGMVDSEVLVHLAKAWKDENNGASFSVDTCNWIKERIEGPCTALLFDTQYPTKIAWIKSVRPLVFCYIKEAGLLVAVSEVDILNAIKFEYKKLQEIYNVDLPVVTFTHTSVIDKRCGIIDTEKEIGVYDNVTYKIIEDVIAGCSVLTDATNRDFVKTYGYYNSSNSGNYSYSRSNNNSRGSSNSRSNTTNVYNGNAGKTNQEPNKIAPAKSEHGINGMVETFIYSNIKGEFFKSNVTKDSILPSSAHDSSTRDWPDSLEKIRPLKNCNTAYDIESRIRTILNTSYKSLTVMKSQEIAEKIETITLKSVAPLIKSLEKKTKKQHESCSKARRRVFAAKKFINAILPYVNISKEELCKVTGNLSTDDAKFIGRIIQPKTLEISSISMEEYIKSLTQKVNGGSNA